MSKIDLKLNFDEIIERIEQEKQIFKPSEWAEKLGVSRNIVTNIHGTTRQKPSLEYIIAVSRAVNKPAEYFLWGKKERNGKKELELSETHYDEISDIINILKTMDNDDIRQFGKMIGEWQKLKKELREMKEKLTEMEKILNK